MKRKSQIKYIVNDMMTMIIIFFTFLYNEKKNENRFSNLHWIWMEYSVISSCRMLTHANMITTFVCWFEQIFLVFLHLKIQFCFIYFFEMFNLQL